MNVYKYIEFFNNYLNEFKINCTCSIFLCQAGKWSTKSYNSRSKVLQNWSAFLFTRYLDLENRKCAEKCKMRVRCVQKWSNYPTSPIPEKKNHSNHICRLFSLLHCRYKHIPTIHTHDWDGTFIDNTFYKGILLLSIIVPNHGYRYLQCKKADHLIHLDGILRKVPSQPPRHALQIWHDQVYNLVPSKAKFLSK